MLFYWLRKLILWLWWLVRLPSKLDVARVNPNSACPVCNAKRGSLRCVVLFTTGNTTQQATLCQHRCLQCGARWYEHPVVAVGVNYVQPAVARNELERREDTELVQKFNRAVGVQKVSSSQRKVN